MKHSNGIARDVIKRNTEISYLRPEKEDTGKARLVVFSDAGFPHQEENKRVAQEGCIFGVAFGEKKDSKFHVLGWLSRKQRRSSQSSGQAECIAAMTSVGCAIHAQPVCKGITGIRFPITLVVDSLGLHKTFCTQATPRDYSMMADAHALRLDYDVGIIDKVSWVAGKMNPSDCLTKHLAGQTSGILEQMLSSGKLPADIDAIGNYGKSLNEEE